MKKQKVAFLGKLTKEGKYWAVEIPNLQIYTQGTSKKDAYEMAKDAVEGLADVDGFEVTIAPLELSSDLFAVSANDTKVLFGLMVKSIRLEAGLSQSALAKRIGSKSANSVARYEQFKSSPGMDTVTKLIAQSKRKGYLQIG